MFKCDKCKRITKAGEKQHKEVVDIREKVYVNIDKYGKEKRTTGKEIVKEINVCEKCAEKGEN